MTWRHRLGAAWARARWLLVLAVPMTAAAVWLHVYDAGPIWLRGVMALGSLVAFAAVGAYGALRGPWVDILTHGPARVGVEYSHAARGLVGAETLRAVGAELERLAEAAAASPLPFDSADDVWRHCFDGYHLHFVGVMVVAGRPRAGAHYGTSRLIRVAVEWRGRESWQSTVYTEAVWALFWSAYQRGYDAIAAPGDPGREVQWITHRAELGL